VASSAPLVGAAPLLARWRSSPELTVRQVAELFGVSVATAAKLRPLALGVDLVVATPTEQAAG
jgi:hypothetical protein